jgi:hypothetical protein
MGWLFGQLWRGTWVGLSFSLVLLFFGSVAAIKQYPFLKVFDTPPLELETVEAVLEVNVLNDNQLYTISGTAMYDSGYYRTTTLNAFSIIPTYSKTSYYGVLNFDEYWMLVVTDTLPDENITTYTGSIYEISNDVQEIIQDLENYFEGKFLNRALYQQTQGALKTDVISQFVVGALFALGGLFGVYRFVRKRFPVKFSTHTA